MHRHFSLLIAPPAWGKTQLFHRWLETEPRPFLYVSPLRALANEVAAAARGVVPVWAPQGDEWRGACEAWLRGSGARALVVTPEQVAQLEWEELARRHPDVVVVWDEIHLVPLWGESFRPRLLEAWWGFCASGLAGVGLTATAGATLETFLRASLEGVYEAILRGDAGDHAFKCPPQSWSVGPRIWLTALLEIDPCDPRPALVFCATRADVDAWVTRLAARGSRVLGCKGGETGDFARRLATRSHWDFVVATSCLSHGVNLPDVRLVVFLYAERHPALFHQMCTRGGRRGEPYGVAAPWGARGEFPRVKAFLSLAGRAMMGWWRGSLDEWWNGVGRRGHAGGAPEGARPHRQVVVARRHRRRSVRLRRHGRRHTEQAAGL